MKKIEKINNYLVVTDTVTSNIELDHPAADIVATVTENTVKLLSLSGLIKRFLAKAFTAAVGSVELTAGASGSVNGITVDGVQIMSGAENFDTDLDTTAQNVANNINAFTSAPNYTATANGAIVTISASVLGGGENNNAVVSSATTITTSDTNMAGGGSTLAKTGNVAFDNEAELVTFLRTNTGA